MQLLDFCMEPQVPGICMDSDASEFTHPLHVRRYKIPRCYDNIVGKPLSDRKIEQYLASGWYSADQKLARKERAEKKKNRRRGNFDDRDGRLIYNPW